jgi:hypothetical protein
MQTFADIVTELAMDKTCTIERTPETDGPYGNQAGTPIVVIETVCLVKMLPTPFLIQAHDEKLGVLAKWTLGFPLGTNPLEGDIVNVEGQKILLSLIETPESFSVMDMALGSEIE